MRFIRYVLDAGGHVELNDIPSPQHRFKTVEEAIRLSLDQEKKVTEQINQLVELAIKERDHITQNALSWFVNEQLE
jgi:ferritin